ncbi:hypothetical protein SSX86_023134 [Deinandra increscens subsp. villosa]|uniref:Uncharacterized protein n=1 Tax=Deinandra increscens subsp. villosa TaxID=3103831 RepID=A0AAP0CK69_9ASTR
MKNFVIGTPFYLFLILITSYSFQANAQNCKPSGHIRGRKPPFQDSASKTVTRFVASHTSCTPHTHVLLRFQLPPTALLHLDSFEKGRDGGAPSKCDNRYHSDNSPVVALSTGWYRNGERCRNFIRINANGRSVKAMVVDVCDSSVGCDKHHDYLPPCQNNIIVASKAIWEALGIPGNSWGEMQITWTDA